MCVATLKAAKAWCVHVALGLADMLCERLQNDSRSQSTCDGRQKGLSAAAQHSLASVALLFTVALVVVASADGFVYLMSAVGAKAVKWLLAGLVCVTLVWFAARAAGATVRVIKEAEHRGRLIRLKERTPSWVIHKS